MRVALPEVLLERVAASPVATPGRWGALEAAVHARVFGRLPPGARGVRLAWDEASRDVVVCFSRPG